MGIVAERLSIAMKIRNLKQVDLVNKTGIGKSSICTYLAGDYLPKQTNLYKLSKALSVNPAWLMGEDVPMDIAPAIASLPANLLPVKKVRVPLLGNVAAGEPILADQEYDTYVEANEDIRCDFALRVDGDSMEPTIRYGDLVFIRQQDDVDDGEIAAVLVDDSATLKHVYHIKDGLQLISDNPKYRPMICTMPEYDTIRILGKAVAFKRIL